MLFLSYKPSADADEAPKYRFKEPRLLLVGKNAPLDGFGLPLTCCYVLL
jgi:hypothetical protein